MSYPGNEDQWSQQDDLNSPERLTHSSNEPLQPPVDQSQQPQQTGYVDQSQQAANPKDESHSMDQVRSQTEQQIDNAIDNLANKIPGAGKYVQQAKDAASGILDSLEAQAEKRLGGLGGIFGGNKEKDK
ncbi:hypothetical protein [Tengunoibacter tsumagoiensis]|uniref:Uncharacterized protein n=1 Tax=Tengunoibacter tsumagoiensis TaxID=2014871 RepID=A0A402A6M4_9CHLR|nr:hypothetical protein [Tengunoibacter tsumagoiensis]GCE14676.1 hypothetical protein KTT_45350 [Tengunoibacter tsumagoiensis]